MSESIEETSLLFRNNESFVLRKSKWISQMRINFSYAFITLLFFSASVVALLFSISSDKKLYLLLIILIFAPIIIFFVIRFEYYRKICNRGSITTGHVISSKEVIYNDSSGVEIQYSFINGRGEEQIGVADGPADVTDFAPGTTLSVLLYDESNFHVVL